MLTWVRDNLKDLKPENFYKRFAYSHTSRKQAEEKLRELLTAIKNENNSINRKKANCLLDSFEPWTQSIDCEKYWLDVETSLGRLAHEVTGRISAYNTIKNFTRKINVEEEALNEFQPPSKRVKNDDPEQQRTPNRQTYPPETSGEISANQGSIKKSGSNSPLYDEFVKEMCVADETGEDYSDPESDTSDTNDDNDDDDNYVYSSESSSCDETKVTKSTRKLNSDVDDGDEDDVFILDDLVTFDEDDNDDPYIFQGENISELFFSYRSKVLQMARGTGLSIATDYREVLSLSHILLLQADNFSDLQIQEFSRNTLEQLQKNMHNAYVAKTKVASSVKAIFREYIETILDEDLGLKEAKKSLIRSFTKSFENPADQEKFDRMQIVFLQLMENIPVNPLNDLISEGTLTANIISPILRSFFHDALLHPTTWPNTASMSAKVRKLANLDPSRAKQPDMIGNVTNNNKSKYEMMFGEITGEGKNNNKKNSLDLIRLGVFMKDSLDLLIRNTEDNRIVFAWQTIVTSWTGYVMVLTASGLYIMIEIGQVELPKSFQTCGQFIDNVDKLFAFTEKYKYEVQRLHDDINKKKNDVDVPVKMINWCRTTLGTPQFKKIIKKRK